MTLLRFLTAGSVDDGKSTLIGRLLHDTQSIYEDQFQSIRSASTNAGGAIDFSLVTDGLRAERAQGITIDVAYRSLATPRRRFIIADTPGHEQYTRNMATGASTADLAVLLIDVRKGVLPQTRRHAAIAWLLGIRNFAVAVNKMDLADFDEHAFRKVVQEFEDFAAKLAGVRTRCFPICSIGGDNVVTRSTRMPWFTGRPLLEHLETVSIHSVDSETGSRGPGHFRLPVQYVLRSTGEPRRYAGEIASGRLAKGDRIAVFPSGRESRVVDIRIGGREVESAAAPLSISVSLEDDLDVDRGALLADPAHPPLVSRRMVATLLWMNEQPLEIGRPYLVKHSTGQVCASITRIISVVDPATMQRHSAVELALNQFGDVEIETHQPLFCDPYEASRGTGSLIVIDPIKNSTLGAAMISSVNGEGQKETRRGAGLTVWLTGLSSSGKSTIAQLVYEKLWAMGHKVERLDGDAVRQHLNRGLGFSKADRDENVRRIAFIAELLTRNGVIVLVSAISPYRAIRDEIRGKIGDFLEVFVNAPLSVCEQRDLKGIYRRARANEMQGVTGIDDPYEPPLHPDLECRTDRETPAESAANLVSAILARLAPR